MNCDKAEILVHGYLDGELDAAGAAEFERHLQDCPVCNSAMESEQVLRKAIRDGQLYERAPSRLRGAIRAATKPAEPPMNSVDRSPWTWLVAAAAVLALIYGAWQFRPGSAGQTSASDVVASAIVDAHLRALQPGHLADVVSTDQHTVKPWFDGKLPFAPPVRDLMADGYPLLGGRLDVVQGRTVAALAYGRRKHIVSVFVWPGSFGATVPKTGSQQGYNWISWQSGGMEFWAVSDVSPTDLAELQHLLVE